MLKRAALVAVIVAVLSFAVAFQLPVCASAGVLGIPCPGCGLTRAVLTALDGRLTEAIALHPLFPLVAPLFAYALVTTGYHYVVGSPSTRMPETLDRVASYLAISIATLAIGIWVARFFGALGGPVPVESWSTIKH